MIEKPAVTLSLEGDPDFARLRSNLVKIKRTPGVRGYILRNTTTAVIDLQDPRKLVEYALLSSEATDACRKMSDLFSIDASKIVVEGSEMKMLCTIMGENRLCIFMEKNVDHANLQEQISL